MIEILFFFFNEILFYQYNSSMIYYVEMSDILRMKEKLINVVQMCIPIWNVQHKNHKWIFNG